MKLKVMKVMKMKVLKKKLKLTEKLKVMQEEKKDEVTPILVNSPMWDANGDIIGLDPRPPCLGCNPCPCCIATGLSHCQRGNRNIQIFARAKKKEKVNGRSSDSDSSNAEQTRE